MALTIFTMTFLLLVSTNSSFSSSSKQDKDWLQEEWEDDYIEEEVITPRAEALMEVEVLDEEEEIGPSLGRVLGKMYHLRLLSSYYFIHVLAVGSVIVIIFYMLGMGYKLYKIWKGEYVEEEPVFLKYK